MLDSYCVPFSLSISHWWYLTSFWIPFTASVRPLIKIYSTWQLWHFPFCCLYLGDKITVELSLLLDQEGTTLFSQFRESRPGGCRDVSVCTVIHFLTMSSVLIGQNNLQVLSMSVMPEQPLRPLMASKSARLTLKMSSLYKPRGVAPSSVLGFCSNTPDVSMWSSASHGFVTEFPKVCNRPERCHDFVSAAVSKQKYLLQDAEMPFLNLFTCITLSYYIFELSHIHI